MNTGLKCSYPEQNNQQKRSAVQELLTLPYYDIGDEP